MAGRMNPVCHYYVDEAGDSNIFTSKGKVIIGTPGCSRYFILGVLDVADPAGLSEAMEKLRQDLLADPYFRDIPSMQPASRKTALAFHATDDVPEVREKVFKLLLSEDVGFRAVVKDKKAVLTYVQQRNQQTDAYRYHPDELYDFLVRRLFKRILHKADEYRILFAKRGKSDRTAALEAALMQAKQRYIDETSIKSGSVFQVSAMLSRESTCLQAADYFLWALQRFYERSEDRYIRYLWTRYRLVIDVDDTRNHGYGEYYDKRNPLFERK